MKALNIICCKWYYNKSVLLLATNVDGMYEVSNVMTQTKGSATKTSVSCPNIIKLYDNGIGCVDIIDQNQLLTDSIIKATITLLENVF